mmetsp:Transcript_86793/g.265682  ORF Transcript_86793/g.265682 Transcript_86793/m.265682 type:complete len:201 (-) Transcript_86793:216-818(-)
MLATKWKIRPMPELYPCCLRIKHMSPYPNVGSSAACAWLIGACDDAAASSKDSGSVKNTPMIGCPWSLNNAPDNFPLTQFTSDAARRSDSAWPLKGSSNDLSSSSGLKHGSPITRTFNKWGPSAVDTVLVSTRTCSFMSQMHGQQQWRTTPVTVPPPTRGSVVLYIVRASSGITEPLTAQKPRKMCSNVCACMVLERFKM